MTIKENAWKRFLEQLRTVNDKATESILYYLQEFGMPESPEAMDDLIYAAWNISTKYGEAAAELAAEMYDTMAELSGKYVPPALPAPTPTRDEVAHAILGTVDTGTKEMVAAAVGRQVKMTGVDTTMQNALRDGAEWAWIPSGRTCAFCLTLASRGWQRASKKAIKNGHAEHIHANCDCTYAVRFDGKSTVAGYDPEKLKAEYDAHNGNISAWQRDLDAPRREKINARKRELYAEQKAQQEENNKTPVLKQQGTGSHMRNPMVKTDKTADYYSTAVPGMGKLIKDAGFPDDKYHIDEKRVAELIHQIFGGELHLRAETNGPSPDYLWRDKYWDLKSPQSIKNTTKLIQKGLHQIFENPGGIICDIRNLNNIPLEAVEREITERMKTSLTAPVDVIIIDGDRVVKVIGYKK